MKFALMCLTSIICICAIGCAPKATTEALGTLERDRILLKATAAEVITSVFMSDGQDVREGEPIIQLDDTKQKYQLAMATASLANANASLLKLHRGARSEDVAGTSAQVTRAKSQFLEAQKTFERTAALVEKKLADLASLDSARAIRDSAKADVEQARQHLLVLTNGSRAEDVAQAEAQVEQAKALVQLEQRRLDELTIRATRTGKLDRLPKYLGERVNLGDPVAIILASGAPYALVYVPEPARVKVNAGRILNIKIDGIKNVIKGKVRWISQDPAFTPYYALNSVDRARLVYLTEIQLPDEAKDFPSGVPVQVELPNE
jgi:HlyD family secretion protein